MIDREPQRMPDIINAFPILSQSSSQFIESYQPEVPVSADTTYELYKDSKNQLYAHVATDHPSPQQDSKDFIRLSRIYKMTDLVRPYSASESIPIQPDEELSDDFFIKEGLIYHYLANVIKAESNSNKRDSK